MSARNDLAVGDVVILSRDLVHGGHYAQITGLDGWFVFLSGCCGQRYPYGVHCDFIKRASPLETLAFCAHRTTEGQITAPENNGDAENGQA